MRVLHLRCSTGFAGPEQGMLRLAVALREIGITIEIVAYCRDRYDTADLAWLIEEARREGVGIESWRDRARFPLSDIARLADRLGNDRFDLLVTHDHKSDLMGYLATRRRRVPWVAAVHGYDFSLKRMHLYRLVDLWLLRRAELVTAVSRSLRDELLAAGVLGPRLRTVRNGIPVDTFADGAAERGVGWRERIGDERGAVVVCVGRLAPQKGLDHLVDAAARVVRSIPSARFWLVGEGPLRRRLEGQIGALGLQDVVRLLGHQRDVSGLMAAADVVVLPSLGEALPNVLLEALALARPVVATRVGGVPEVVQDGETGRLVAPADPLALAEAIAGLLRDGAAARRFGERGRRHVAHEFSAARFAAETAEVYREVLDAARGAKGADVGPLPR